MCSSTAKEYKSVVRVPVLKEYATNCLKRVGLCPRFAHLLIMQVVKNALHATQLTCYITAVTCCINTHHLFTADKVSSIIQTPFLHSSAVDPAISSLDSSADFSREDTEGCICLQVKLNHIILWENTTLLAWLMSASTTSGRRKCQKSSINYLTICFVKWQQ